MLYIIFTNGLGLGELCYADDTKLFQIIRNMDDRNSLQEKLNKIEKWSEENGLTLNASKTFHISFGKKAVNTLYFLKSQIIKEVDQVRDLGVIFDKNLTFKPHIEYISKRISQMIGAARRFVSGINQPLLISRIYTVYIQPIMEYGATVWNQNRLTINNMLTLAHKKVTRIALNIYYTMNPDRYIAYEKRCEILNQDGPVRRRASQAAQICIKIIKGEIDMSFGQLIRDHVNTNQERRIRRLLNRTNNNIDSAQKSNCYHARCHEHFRKCH